MYIFYEIDQVRFSKTEQLMMNLIFSEKLTKTNWGINSLKIYIYRYRNFIILNKSTNILYLIYFFEKNEQFMMKKSRIYYLYFVFLYYIILTLWNSITLLEIISFHLYSLNIILFWFHMFRINIGAIYDENDP